MLARQWAFDSSANNHLADFNELVATCGNRAGFEVRQFGNLTAAVNFSGP